MRIAWIDCFAGISGDMTLGALIDCGVPLDYLRREINKLGLKGYSIDVGDTVRNHITAKKVHIAFDSSSQPDRRYKNIRSMITRAQLSTGVREKALRAFEILGIAEAKIHGIPLDEVHFHELGAVDSIIDLVGSIIGFEYLGVEKIYSSPVPLGTGFAKTEHGTMPVPSPAALAVLKGYPIVQRDSDYEMTTPTGATLIRVLSEGLIPPDMVLNMEKSGYGAGYKKIDQWPNVLRLIIADTPRSQDTERIIVAETNLDDLNPEIYPYLMQRLFESGARDVYLTPLIMKKGRPGIKISVLTAESDIPAIEQILFRETSTIGIRKYPVERTVLDRKTKKIMTRYGEIEVKVSSHNGRETLHPEYEACLKVAREKGVSLIDIYREIESMNIP